MLGARSRLVRGVLAQLSQLFGATVLCHGVLQRKSLVRDLFRLVSYRPLAGSCSRSAEGLCELLGPSEIIADTL